MPAAVPRQAPCEQQWAGPFQRWIVEQRIVGPRRQERK